MIFAVLVMVWESIISGVFIIVGNVHIYDAMVHRLRAVLQVILALLIAAIQAFVSNGFRFSKRLKFAIWMLFVLVGVYFFFRAIKDRDMYQACSLLMLLVMFPIWFGFTIHILTAWLLTSASKKVSETAQLLEDTQSCTADYNCAVKNAKCPPNLYL